MNIEVDDDVVCEIVKRELIELYEHSKEGWFEIDEDTGTLQSAISLVLKQYMIPSEYSNWALDKMVGHAEKHGMYDLEDTKKSDTLDVTLLKEHEDGSATYQFDLTPEYADALLQNGIMWAIVSGVTGITIDKVLEEYKERDEE